MMDNYTDREVREALEPYHDKIRGAILEGYAEYLAVERFRAKNNFGPQLYPRTGANDVFDAVARNARAVFGVEPGVRVIDETQTVKFFFGGKVIGRFKKGRRRTSRA
ncbi:hypothetical protein [Aurantimonas marina]|uniref:hypothetical protein n=1 Tax=Aurantimonas marina TaxID=2780508 RepID=UPI001E3A076C|nr:hypothetical protein [Aurantimonas marina]